jgi:hypothetical protein
MQAGRQAERLQQATGRPSPLLACARLRPALHLQHTLQPLRQRAGRRLPGLHHPRLLVQQHF